MHLCQLCCSSGDNIEEGGSEGAFFSHSPVDRGSPKGSTEFASKRIDGTYPKHKTKSVSQSTLAFILFHSIAFHSILHYPFD